MPQYAAVLAYAAGAQEGRQPTVSTLLTPVSLNLLVRRRFPICDRSEKEERQSVYRSVSFSAYSQFTDNLLLLISESLRSGRHSYAAPTIMLNRCAWHALSDAKETLVNVYG